MTTPNLGVTLMLEPAVAHVLSAEQLETEHGLPGTAASPR
jgi:hypothetical protein